MATDSTPATPRADDADVRGRRGAGTAPVRRSARVGRRGIALVAAGALGLTALVTAQSAQSAQGSSWSAGTAPAAGTAPLCGDAWEGADFQVDLALHVRNDTDDPVRVVSARVIDAENLTVRSLGTDAPWLEPGGRLAPAGRPPDAVSPAEGGGVVGSPGLLGPMHMTVASSSETAPAFRLLRAPALTVIPAHGAVTLVADAALTDPERPGSAGGLELDIQRDGGTEAIRSTVPVVVERGGASLPAACGA